MASSALRMRVALRVRNQCAPSSNAAARFLSVKAGNNKQEEGLYDPYKLYEETHGERYREFNPDLVDGEDLQFTWEEPEQMMADKSWPTTSGTELFADLLNVSNVEPTPEKRALIMKEAFRRMNHTSINDIVLPTMSVEVPQDDPEREALEIMKQALDNNGRIKMDDKNEIMASLIDEIQTLRKDKTKLFRATTACERQYAIWASRIRREYEKCQQIVALPRGVTLRHVHIDEAAGVCKGEFHCYVPFREGSEALSLVPLIALEFSTPFEQNLATEESQYPFRAPEVTVTCGRIYLPTELFEARVCGTVGADGEYKRCLLRLPSLIQWNPSNTIPMVLHDFIQQVQQHDPQPVVAVNPQTRGASAATKDSDQAQSLRMRRRDIHGNIYQCREVDNLGRGLLTTPMLLQNAKVVLLDKQEVHATNARAMRQPSPQDPLVHVREVIPLRDVARITPQKGKSVTFFFKKRGAACRTFLTPQTDEIIHDIRRMIAASSAGAKRGRDDNGSSTNLLSFLTQDQTEKAKEFSNKIMGKVGKFASSMSRFLRGDDDQGQQAPDPLAVHFQEIERMKSDFFRIPSQAKMTEITRKYQWLAEGYAHTNNTEGHVERAVEQLQAFIEHPTTQRVLLEACTYEQNNRGIRVGPVGEQR
ncbi:TPA: LOW QUALITY PROTEIN: hypothetical protein N0F65_001902 [Lagenidium giganteum]|uniref:Uncharacterized protein n=1 Tax=Lagenidium giganteum TaxID=4803 RepID=A0AAV2YXG4_9STRA|nr:TPA: LOW QUALITY PROTEIN: hypothetical protein N0F65_001902 [Lagenidium giganteum]